MKEEKEAKTTRCDKSCRPTNEQLEEQKQRLKRLNPTVPFSELLKFEISVREELTDAPRGSCTWFRLVNDLHRFLLKKCILGNSDLSAEAYKATIKESFLDERMYYIVFLDEYEERVRALYGQDHNISKADVERVIVFIYYHIYDFGNWLMGEKQPHGWICHRDVFDILLDEYIHVTFAYLFNPNENTSNPMAIDMQYVGNNELMVK